MSEEETKQVFDNLYAKLNEEEKLFLAIASNEKNKEIERLNKGYCKFKEQCGKYATCLRENQLKEINRLNNIINEFNKLIENEINESKLEEDYDRVDALEYCLATLRELKGSDE